MNGRLNTGSDNMSIEQIDTETLSDRKQLEQLTIQQLCRLLHIPIKNVWVYGFTKDNLIEMLLKPET